MTLSKEHIAIFGIIAAIFLVSANMAWLNPNPDYVVKTNPTIPLFWQYNGDATVEFLSAAYFPEYFKVDKTRTNRPGYPLAAHILAKVYGAIAWPIHTLNALQSTMLGYLTLKILVYLAGALALYDIARRWFSREVALLSVALAFLHPFAVTFIGTFHTSELQFITPILLVWMWLNLGEKYSHQKNILSSLLTGYLMVTKQNYAAYLALLAFSFLILKRYKESILSVAVHLIPFGLWLLALKLLHIPYYNHESANGLGVWLYKDLIHRSPAEIIQTLVRGTNGWLLLIVGYFSFLALAAVWAAGSSAVKEKFGRHHTIFILIFVAMSWLQTFASNRYASYMSSDLAVIIFPLAAYAIYALFERFSIKKYLPLFLALYLFAGLSTLIHFPWVHPYDQTDITHPDRVKLLEEGKLVPRNEG
ncbi:glycosyltransferase family 39 protein [Candidatus Parcubacteria bacterium]|nr:glycosyltransferase family 39 protein [Candidatus Parcubacteria bacterium]